MSAVIYYGTLTTTAVTANQVVLSFTPKRDEVVRAIVLTAYLTVYDTGEVALGLISLRQGAAIKMLTRFQNTDLDSNSSQLVVPLGEGITFSGAEVIDVVVTPASATSMDWSASVFCQRQ